MAGESWLTTASEGRGGNGKTGNLPEDKDSDSLSRKNATLEKKVLGGVAHPVGWGPESAGGGKGKGRAELLPGLTRKKGEEKVEELTEGGLRKPERGGANSDGSS